MSRITDLLNENSSRPQIQAEIRKAAEIGAKDAGFSMTITSDNHVKYGNEETYNNQDEANQAAWQSIQENVNLD